MKPGKFHFSQSKQENLNAELSFQENNMVCSIICVKHSLYFENSDENAQRF